MPSPLPAIPVPVRAPHPDARPDLRRIVHRISDAAGYHYDIDDGRPDPPLGPEDPGRAAAIVPTGPAPPDLP